MSDLNNLDEGSEITAYMERHGFDLDAFDDERSRASEGGETDDGFRPSADDLAAVEGGYADGLAPNPFQVEQSLQAVTAPAGDQPQEPPGDDLPTQDAQPLPVQPQGMPSMERVQQAEVMVAHERQRIDEAKQDPMLARLRTEDAGEWTARQMELQQAELELQIATQQVAGFKENLVQEAAFAELLDVIPEWQDEAVRTREANAVGDYLLGQGFNGVAIANMTPGQLQRARHQWQQAAAGGTATAEPEVVGLWDGVTDKPELWRGVGSRAIQQPEQPRTRPRVVSTKQKPEAARPASEYGVGPEVSYRDNTIAPPIGGPAHTFMPDGTVRDNRPGYAERRSSGNELWDIGQKMVEMGLVD